MYESQVPGVFEFCTCLCLKRLYEEIGVAFLPKSCDTIKFYETRNNENPTSQYDTGMRALQNMDRVQQVEVLSGKKSFLYSTLKTYSLFIMHKFFRKIN